MGALALCPADLRAIDGEPRVRDLRLGEVLGFSQIRDLRKIIRRNIDELAQHGAVSRHRGAKPLTGSAGGRPEEGFLLNEAQALLICMFSRTRTAAAVRKQIIDVFIAYRHGKLTPSKPTGQPVAANDRDERWAKNSRRFKRLRDAVSMQDLVQAEKFAHALAYVPTILFLEHDDGRRRKQRRPRWWGDMPVRSALVALHRQMTIDDAIIILEAEFGPERAPSRSSLGRFWRSLDDMRAAS